MKNVVTPGIVALVMAIAAQALAWSPYPLQDRDKIELALSRGSAAAPSATFPLTIPGAPVGCWWDETAFHVGETAFPFDKLGVKPVDGATFRVKVPRPTGKPLTLEVVLKEKAATYAVEDFGILGNQTVTKKVRFTAQEDGKVKLFWNAVGPRSPRFIRDRVKPIKAGETVEIEVNGPAVDSGHLIYDLFDTDGKVMFMAFYPFHDPAVKFAYRTTISDPEKMTLLMRVDQWINPGEAFDLTIRMTDLETGDDVGFSATRRLDEKTGMFDIPFDVTALRPGCFKMFYDVKNAKTGELIHSDYAYYAKPDGKCVWDDTTYGDDDSVPPPWTPPVFDARGFSVWNRTVRFEKGLVSSVVSAGEELLAAPVEVLWNGRPLAFESAGVERHVSFADYLFRAHGAPVTAKVRVEFDGLMVFTLDYRPPVEALSVRVPMRRDRVVGFDDCSDPMKKLALPPGATAEIAYNPEQKPWWWMGSAVGLMGGIQSLRGWYCRHLEKGFAFAADANVAALTMNVVDEPCREAGTRSVAFYLQPTPVKPKNTALALQSRHEMVTWTGYLSKNYETKLPGFIVEDRVAGFRKQVEAGKRVFYYNGTRGTSPIQPWWGWLGQEWEEYGDPAFFSEEVQFKSREDRERNVWVCGCLNSKSFRDFKIWTVCWFLNHPDYGVKDLYFDLAGPTRNCKNHSHPCSWKDEFGRLHHDNTLFSCREVHKRAYKEMKRKNADSAMLGHLAYQRTPSDVFFDRLWMGETYDRFIRGTMSYYDVLNPEMMQIQYASRTSEVVIDMLPQIDRAMSMYLPDKVKSYDPHTPENDRINRHATAYFKIHDLEVTPQGHGANQWEAPDRALKAFGKDRIHRAYYHPDCPISVSAPDPRFIYAAFRGNGKTMVILLNDTDREIKETISVKGVSGTGREILRKTAFDFTTGACDLTFGPREALFIAFGDEGAR